MLDEIKKKGLVLNEKNEREIRERFRKDHGMAAFAILNLPKLEKLIKKGNVIADGLYSFEEFKVLKENFNNRIILIAVFAPPHLRYKRLTSRIISKEDKELRDRPFTKAESKTRDFAELENLNKGATIAMADYTILNTKDSTFLIKQIKETEKEIKKSYAS